MAQEQLNQEQLNQRIEHGVHQMTSAALQRVVATPRVQGVRRLPSAEERAAAAAAGAAAEGHLAAAAGDVRARLGADAGAGAVQAL